MKTIYLAGPISLGGTCAPEQVAAFTRRFTETAEQLRAAGHTVLVPTELGERASWLAYMRETVPMLCAADEVRVLPRWKESRGARIEVQLARDLGIPVVSS